MIIPSPYQYLGAFAAAFAAGVVSAAAVTLAIKRQPGCSN